VRVRHRVAQPANHHRHVTRQRIGDQQGELVTAVACKEIGVPEQWPPGSRDCPQQPVTATLTLGVVDRPEVVDVEESEGHRVAIGRRSCQRLAQVSVESATVRQPCQGVDLGRIGRPNQPSDHDRNNDQRGGL
jgi:hypothetical protein